MFVNSGEVENYAINLADEIKEAQCRKAHSEEGYDQANL